MERINEVVVEMRDVTKRFGEVNAVNKVSLDVPQGVIFGFIGPSGCGKTTTVRLLNGNYGATEGTIKVLGQSPDSFKREDQKRIGYMPQLFILYPELTIWENLNFAASIYGYPMDRKERLYELLELVELTGHEKKMARNISGGMQRRLSLASTLIHSPELIFLDEPTAGIDPVLRRKFWDHFQTLKDQGHTLFVTTQYVGEAAYCDYVGVMRNGELLMVETPEMLRYKALGGEMTVTVFEGQGHNYWTGFFQDKKMAEFIIKHAKPATLPKVLFFGDSISGGYSMPLIKLMEGKAQMVKLGAVATYRINEEAWWHSSRKAKALDFGSAKACIADIDRFGEHLASNRYDVIHFNFGLNDIFRGRGGAWHNPVDQYARDLETIVALLKKNGAKIIWSNTTPVPANAPHNPEGDELIYNAAAAEVMKQYNIPIIDLRSVVTQWDGYEKWKQGDDVHFSSAVYTMLANQIAEVVSSQLESQADPENE